MIGDVNQVLTYGGIFAYPHSRTVPRQTPPPVRRNPIAYVIESAGSRSSDGTQSILEIDPEIVHERVPLHVGNTDLIERLESALA